MVNKIKYNAICFCLLLLCPLGILSQEQVVEVVFTSDMHGSVRALNYLDDSVTEGGLTRIATYIADLRETSDSLIILDGGDTIQGNPLMYLASKRYDYMPNPIIKAMNMIGYDAMALGNHEFNFGLEYLRKAEGMAKFPFLSANTLDGRTGEPAFTPYKIISRQGLKIGLLGLTTPSIPQWELPENYKGLKFETPEVAARKYIPILREYEKCNLVIVILHSGFAGQDESGEYALSTYEDSAAAVANVEGIDLLLTGHKHRLIEPQYIGKTFAVAAPAYASSLIRVSLTISPDGSVSHLGEVVPMNSYITEKEDIVEAVKSLHIETENYLNNVLCTTSEELTANPDRLHDSRLMDILQQAQLEYFQADISAASLLPWSGSTIPVGDVTIKQMFQFYPFENRLVMIKITGEKLKAYLEWSARYYSDAELNSEGELEIVPGRNIKPYNVDFVEGLSYRIDPKEKAGNKIKDLKYLEKPLNMDDEFKMVLNSYRYMGGGNYEMLRGCEVLQFSDTGIREILINYLKTKGLGAVKCSENWFVAPDLSLAGN